MAVPFRSVHMVVAMMHRSGLMVTAIKVAAVISWASVAFRPVIAWTHIVIFCRFAVWASIMNRLLLLIVVICISVVHSVP